MKLSVPQKWTNEWLTSVEKKLTYLSQEDKDKVVRLAAEYNKTMYEVLYELPIKYSQRNPTTSVLWYAEKTDLMNKAAELMREVRTILGEELM